MVQGLEQGYFSITDGLIGNVLRISGGCAPGNTFFMDSLILLPARVRY